MAPVQKHRVLPAVTPEKVETWLLCESGVHCFGIPRYSLAGRSVPAPIKAPISVFYSATYLSKVIETIDTAAFTEQALL